MTYQALSATNSLSSLGSEHIGNSDEDEIVRDGGRIATNDWLGFGDPFVDLSEDAKELGLIPNE